MEKFIELFNDKNAQNSFDPNDVKTTSNALVASLPYFLPILFFLPILINKQSAYCKFHANQQLTWLIVSVIIGVICGILGLIPVLGAIIGAVIGLAWLAVSFLLFYSAFKGNAVRIPFVGNMISIF